MEKGVGSRAVAASTVEQRCPICLEDFENKTFIDSCFHILLHVCFKVGEREREREEGKEGRERKREWSKRRREGEGEGGGR